MAKRNTVRINMDLLDEYLKAKNIHPKDFCEKQLGFSDGWYYGIRKNGGRGVKVLVAQLIARSIGVEYETLVIDEGAGRKGDGNPSVTKGDSSLCTREPLTAERAGERGTGNPSPTEETGENRKSWATSYVEIAAKLNKANKTLESLEKENDELKQERIQLLFSIEAREGELKEARTDLEQLEKYNSEIIKLHAAVSEELKSHTLCISKDTLLDILISATGESLYKEFAKGAAYVVDNLLRVWKKQIEETKNARPE